MVWGNKYILQHSDWVKTINSLNAQAFVFSAKQQ